MNALRGRCFLLALAWAGFNPVFAEEEEKEAMEIGGLLTVDGANRFSKWENTEAQLGLVELSAKVHVEKNMEGAITLVSEGDPTEIGIDQAVGQWTLGASQIVFGQQYFSFGLLTTRLISDPAVLDRVEFSQAGVTGLRNLGPWTFGLGLTSLATGDELDPEHNPCLIGHVDFAPGENLLRLSSLASKERVGVDAAANLAWKGFYFDLEGAWRFRDDDGLAKGGGLAGLAYGFNRYLDMGFRWDFLSDADHPLQYQKIAGGLTVNLEEHVFGAGEIAWDEDGVWTFALQMGLRSELKLPGFQRKTLVKENN